MGANLDRNNCISPVPYWWLYKEKRNRLYIFGTKVFVPRGQRLRRPLKKIITFGEWTPEQNKPPQYDESYNTSIGAKYYKNISLKLKLVILAN